MRDGDTPCQRAKSQLENGGGEGVRVALESLGGQVRYTDACERQQLLGALLGPVECHNPRGPGSTPAPPSAAAAWLL